MNILNISTPPKQYSAMRTRGNVTPEPTSWAPIGESFSRTQEQIIADDRELAERKARCEKASGTLTKQRRRAVNGGKRSIAVGIGASHGREGANV